MGNTVEVLLGHPGGPEWVRKDDGAWSTPKGLVEGDGSDLDTAVREFREETGITARGPFLELGQVRSASGKRICAWAFEGTCDPAEARSNTFTMEWPPKSGKIQEFPELDRVGFFTLPEARQKLHAPQVALLDRLIAALALD